jgi:curli biogenesis system outer membrane secretion channel CsgG
MLSMEAGMFRKSLILSAAILLSLSAAVAQKKRVAVMNFDYAAVTTSVTQLFGTNQDVGKGIADLLVDKLVSDGVYSVIERKQLDKIIAEQNFSNSDRADPSSAAKIARILGVDAIIIGSITQFGRDDRKTNLGAGVGALGRFGIGGVSKSNSMAVVQVTGRMIDTSTAEILASASAKGESSRSGTGILGSGGNWSGDGAGGLDMRSSNFGATILGEATSKAVDEMAKELEAKAASLPTVKIEVSGMVADAAPDGTIIINVGSKSGVKVGDTLAIKHKVRDVKDPATGKVLRSIEDPVGTIKITEVEDGSATGKFEGAGKPQVGDTVSSK